MSFHSEDCVKYLESGRHLMDEKLESAAKYFKHILNLQVAEGSLTKKHEHQIEYRQNTSLVTAQEMQQEEVVEPHKALLPAQ